MAAMKAKGSKLVMITAYDYASARCVVATSVDLILVGDSLGMVVLGYPDTLKVTMGDMISHCAAVRRGAPDKYIIADMPYMSYHLDTCQAKANAARLIVDGAADAVKLEGGGDSRLEVIRAIVDCEIPVCAHLGLTPQSIHRFGGYKVQGKTPGDHTRLLSQALAIQEAGAFMLVVEGIPEQLGKEISASLHIPVIGIGAGRFTDGQVLVFHDLLGMTPQPAKFVQTYATIHDQSVSAIERYATEVRTGAFPSVRNIYYPIN
ncbi:MAG: 3-methyl-2-oxobutanoate hydroxymethyltransferase [Candidatus Cloacimonetes bacterium]|nr:3-methyl-2-oxobutanoate hydroxymethyltransferase [Candidatus Cloacimonadota bacterium]